MKRIALTLALLAAFAAHASHTGDYTAGEVRKVDKAAGKITLKHGEIKSLNMPPMSMVFGVADPSVLDKYKPGDKVQFRARDEGGGKFVVEAIQPDH